MSIDEINEFLISLFVEKKELFSKMILELNETLKESKIDYQYSYDDFCHDFLEINKEFFKRHPEVDYTDTNMIFFYTNIIIGELLLKLKTNYNKNDGSMDNG